MCTTSRLMSTSLIPSEDDASPLDVLDGHSPLMNVLLPQDAPRRRHGAVSAMIRAGVDPVRIARFVGDRVETILSTYAHEWATLRDDNLGDVLDAARAASS
jgi:hypothetical protein